MNESGIILDHAPSASGVLLRNDQWLARILPEEGGRIASLFDLGARLEYLLQPARGFPARQSQDLWDRFENSACAGIDDCLPSVGACDPDTPGGPIPDHGDLWRLHWSILSSSASESVTLAATCYSRTLHLEKRIHLRGSCLEIRYCLRNLQEAPVPFLYALHPLLAIDPGDRILLPPDVKAVRIESSRLQRLGDPGSVVAWPHPSGPGSGFDLSRTDGIDAATAEMLYTDRLQAGWCGLYRAQTGNGIILRFHPRQLPYLGLWLCYGGWPDDARNPSQYAVAFEPTVSPRGTLIDALKHNEAPVLAGYAAFHFDIALQRVGPDCATFDEFASRCRNRLRER